MRKMRARSLFSLAVTLVLVLPISAFSQQTEFPNYFLPKKYRGLPANQIPASVVVEQKVKLEAAMQSIFKRIVIPVADENGIVKGVRYFENAKKLLPEGVQMMPAGGVVRTTIGYIYAKMVEAQERGQDPEKVLSNLTRGTSDIPAIEIRGVGSDWDILLEGKEPELSNAKKLIVEMTNSAEKHFKAEKTGGFKKALFPVADAKSYADQITRSTNQGGATIDFLAFDLKTGKFVEPNNMRYITNDLIKGIYRYLAPESAGLVEDFDKQVLRGPRSLVELPFLSIEDDHQLKTELGQLIAQVKSGASLSLKATEQFGKMLRNARFSGANNRIYRGKPGSVESLVQELSDLIYARDNISPFPEFVDKISLSNRDPNIKRELNGLPKELLTSSSDFIKLYTDHGALYHGVPNLDRAMAIIRGGLFVSGGRNNQGRFAHGSGGYLSPNPETSDGYAGSDGFRFAIKVINDPRLNIINLDDPHVASHPFIQKAQSDASKLGMDINRYLKNFHGIDVVKDFHVELQNMEAVKLDATLKGLLDALYSKVKQKGATFSVRYHALAEYERLGEYASLAGVSGLKKALTKGAFLKSNDKLLLDIFTSDPVQTKEISGLALEEMVHHLSETTRTALRHSLVSQGLMDSYPWDFEHPSDLAEFKAIISDENLKKVQADVLTEFRLLQKKGVLSKKLGYLEMLKLLDQKEKMHDFFLARKLDKLAELQELESNLKSIRAGYPSSTKTGREYFQFSLTEQKKVKPRKMEAILKFLDYHREEKWFENLSKSDQEVITEFISQPFGPKHKEDYDILFRDGQWTKGGLSLIESVKNRIFNLKETDDVSIVAKILKTGPELLPAFEKRYLNGNPKDRAILYEVVEKDPNLMTNFKWDLKRDAAFLKRHFNPNVHSELKKQVYKLCKDNPKLLRDLGLSEESLVMTFENDMNPKRNSIFETIKKFAKNTQTLANIEAIGATNEMADAIDAQLGELFKTHPKEVLAQFPEFFSGSHWPNYPVPKLNENKTAFLMPETKKADPWHKLYLDEVERIKMHLPPTEITKTLLSGRADPSIAALLLMNGGKEDLALLRRHLGALESWPTSLFIDALLAYGLKITNQTYGKPSESFIYSKIKSFLTEDPVLYKKVVGSLIESRNTKFKLNLEDPLDLEIIHGHLKNQNSDAETNFLKFVKENTKGVRFSKYDQLPQLLSAAKVKIFRPLYQKYKENARVNALIEILASQNGKTTDEILVQLNQQSKSHQVSGSDPSSVDQQNEKAFIDCVNQVTLD